MMSQLPPILALAATILVMAPPPADACSIASDWAEPPAVEQAFDADRAPIPPIIHEATISLRYQDSPGCGAETSCGDIQGLSLNVQVPANAQHALLRVTHQDGSAVFASAVAGGDGLMRLFLPGYDDVDSEANLVFALIDEEGYPSIDVAAVAYTVEDNDPGCQMAQHGTTGGGVLLMVLTAMGMMVWRRRSGQ